MSERVLNCVLKAYEYSDLAQNPYSSRSLVEHLKLNLAFTVGSMQSIIPDFGKAQELAAETEVMFYIILVQTNGKFVEKGQAVRIQGNVQITFLVAENRSLIYDTLIQF